jgi:hypothetical protein
MAQAHEVVKQGVYVDWQGRFWARIEGELGGWSEHTDEVVEQLRDLLLDGSVIPFGFGTRRKLVVGGNW